MTEPGSRAQLIEERLYRWVEEFKDLCQLAPYHAKYEALEECKAYAAGHSQMQVSDAAE